MIEEQAVTVHEQCCILTEKIKANQTDFWILLAEIHQIEKSIDRMIEQLLMSKD